MVTFEEYKEQLIELYDPDELVDILNISIEELVDRFEDKIVIKFESEIDPMVNDP